MDAPIVKATIQSTVMAAISSILAQLIACGQGTASSRACSPSITTIAHFALLATFTCPPNYLWQSWLEAQFPAHTGELTPREKEELVDEAVKGHGSSPATKAASSPPSKIGNGKLNLRNTAIKFMLDQTVGAVVNTVIFIVGLALLRGQAWGSIGIELREQFWPIVFAGQKFWPAVSILSFTLVPLQHRTLFGAVAGLFWGVYVSLVSHEG